MIHCEFGERLAVDFDTGGVDESHELAVGKVLLTSGGVDTLDPQSAEVAFFLLAVAVSVGKTLLPSVLGDGPHITTAAVIAARKFQYFLSLSSGSYVVY